MSPEKHLDQEWFHLPNSNDALSTIILLHTHRHNDQYLYMSATVIVRGHRSIFDKHSQHGTMSHENSIVHPQHIKRKIRVKMP